MLKRPLYVLIAVSLFALTNVISRAEAVERNVLEQESSIEGTIEKSKSNTRADLGFGLGYMSFNYKEQISGKGKSNETGSLPLYKARGAYRLSDLPDSAALEGEFMSSTGTLKYDGSYQNKYGEYKGDLTSKTPTKVMEYQITYVHNLYFDGPGSRLDLFLGYGHHQWFRGREVGVQGAYDEDYNWNFIPVGLKFDFYKNSEWSLQSKFQYGLGFNGKVKAKLSQVDDRYSDLDLPLGNSSSFRLELPVTRFISQNWSVRLAPFYEQINIAKGKFTQLVVNGSPVIENGYRIGVVEPASRTLVYGADLSVVASF